MGFPLGARVRLFYALRVLLLASRPIVLWISTFLESSLSGYILSSKVYACVVVSQVLRAFFRGVREGALVVCEDVLHGIAF